jgi:shingomyelin synthase
MVSQQEIQIEVEHGNGSGMAEQGSSSEESSVKRRGPSPENKNSDSDSAPGDSDRTSLLQKERRGGRLSIKSSAKKNYPAEWLKTLVLLLYTLCCLTAMTIVETIVHDRVPLQNETAPLRDVFWNITAKWPFNTEYGIHAAFRATEIIGLILISLAALHVISHRHTSIILRRFFFHFGTVYLYRVFTISLTILPVPKLPPNQCMPPTDGSLRQVLARSFGQLVGGGMDMTGNNMCGDYMYSGHTCVITSATLFILEYSPKRWWLYHYLCQIVAIIGVLCIMISHEHYTIDVLIAYYVCSNHFWMYHTLASSQELKSSSPEKTPLARVWWWRIFRFMESGVSAPLPRVHSNPFSRAKRFLANRITNSQTPSFSPL